MEIENNLITNQAIRTQERKHLTKTKGIFEAASQMVKDEEDGKDEAKAALAMVTEPTEPNTPLFS